MATKCSCCKNHATDSIDHLFNSSDIMFGVWKHFSSIFGFPEFTSSWRSYVAIWCNHCDQTQVGQLAALVPFLVFWEIWISKNNARFENVGMSVNDIVHNVNRWLRDLNFLLKPKLPAHHFQIYTLQSLIINQVVCKMKRPKFVSWKCPPSSRLKLNCDGSAYGNPGNSGCGGILRDDKCCLIFAFSSYLGNQTNIYAEFMAIRDGLLICYMLNISNICIETDSELIANWWKKGTKPEPKFDTLWLDLVELMGLVSFDLCHIYREQNQVADALAKQGAHGSNKTFFSPMEFTKLTHARYVLDQSETPCVRGSTYKIQDVAESNDVSKDRTSTKDLNNVLRSSKSIEVHNNNEIPDSPAHIPRTSSHASLSKIPSLSKITPRTNRIPTPTKIRRLNRQSGPLTSSTERLEHKNRGRSGPLYTMSSKRSGSMAYSGPLLRGTVGSPNIKYSKSNGLVQLLAIEESLECSLEELYFGCVKKITVARAVIANNGQIVEEEETLSIKVKPGWTKGTMITFEGTKDEEKDTHSCDVVFVIKEKKHALYKREGDDLELAVIVPLLQALTGCDLSIPLLGGEKLNLTINYIIMPGYEKIIEGQGIPKSKEQGHRGNFIIIFQVDFPKKLTENQRSDIGAILRDSC